MEILSCHKCICSTEPDYFEIVFISGERVTLFQDGVWNYEDTASKEDTWIFGTWETSGKPWSPTKVPKCVIQAIATYGNSFHKR